MTDITDREPVDHLLVLQGPAELLDLKCGEDFRLADWLPPPVALREADELDVLAFHLTYGDLEEARKIGSELGLDWPFASDKPTSREVRQYLAGQPELQKNGAEVLRNIQTHGFVSRRAWRKDRWGHPTDVQSGRFERVQTTLAVLRFQDPHSRLPALLNLALQRPESLDVSAIVFDLASKRQFWFDTAADAEDGASLALHEQQFESEDDAWSQSWLVHKPDCFNF